MKIKICRRMFVVSLILLLVLSLAACGKKSGGGRMEKKSDVEQLLDDAKTEEDTVETTALITTEEITTEITTEALNLPAQELDGADGQYAPNMVTGDITTEFPLATGPSQMTGSGATNPGHVGGEFITEEPIADADPNVDVDLTVLTPNMVYSQVYDMLMNADRYIGKKIKVSGPYYPLYYDGTGNYYHYVMIEDALACCKNGMEFIWDEGTHTYPDEYPDEDDIIEIIGEYNSYEEEGYTYYYLDVEGYKVLD